jgi:hypothetical protein
VTERFVFANDFQCRKWDPLPRIHIVDYVKAKGPEMVEGVHNNMLTPH